MPDFRSFEQSVPTREAAQHALDFYRGDEAARRYARVHEGRSRHHREVRCLKRALRAMPPGARVLDLPCGTGRMFPALASLALRITGADASAAMVRHARDSARLESWVEEVRVEDAFRTSFEDDAFDAVVCNRLLHHFPSAVDRRAILRELARVSRGPVVVSFFSLHSFDAIRTRLRKALGRRASSRSAIRDRSFHRDVEAAGLRVTDVVRTLPGISQQSYVVAAP